MRLLKQSGAGWKYELNQNEGILLRALVKEFPLAAATVVKISRTGADPKSAERERLLNESLAQHRQDLKRQARKLLAARLKPGKAGWRLSVNVDEREVLLQLLNNIRVESWHALGEPEDLDTLPLLLSEADLRHRNLMQLAGYFEYKIVEG
ncbi:MAG TPA: hypothetical protein VN784_16280 [Candidatus Limnocylindrales bacterium]|nr:hypothetical protein [Candidatus Limnocylindrales bacterium]